MGAQIMTAEEAKSARLEAQVELLMALLRSKPAPSGKPRFVGGEYPDEP